MYAEIFKAVKLTKYNHFRFFEDGFEKVFIKGENGCYVIATMGDTVVEDLSFTISQKLFDAIHRTISLDGVRFSSPFALHDFDLDSKRPAKAPVAAGQKAQTRSNGKPGKADSGQPQPVQPPSQAGAAQPKRGKPPGLFLFGQKKKSTRLKMGTKIRRSVNDEVYTVEEYLFDMNRHMYKLRHETGTITWITEKQIKNKEWIV